MLVSFVVMVVGFLEALDWVAIIPDNLEQWIIPALGAVFMYLRAITTTPVGKA